MEKSDVAIIIMTFVALSFIITIVYLEFFVMKKEINGNERPIMKEEKNKTPPLKKEEETTDYSYGGGYGEKSKGSGMGGGTGKGENFPTPSEIEKAPCGFYYEKYGVCGGICERGKCVSEGRSCYCKLS